MPIPKKRGVVLQFKKDDIKHPNLDVHEMLQMSDAKMAQKFIRSNDYMFKIKRKHPLSAAAEDSRLILDVPDIEFAEAFLKNLSRLVARYQRFKKEGAKDICLQLIFTGNFVEEK